MRISRAWRPATSPSARSATALPGARCRASLRRIGGRAGRCRMTRSSSSSRFTPITRRPTGAAVSDHGQPQAPGRIHRVRQQSQPATCDAGEKWFAATTAGGVGCATCHASTAAAAPSGRTFPASARSTPAATSPRAVVYPSKAVREGYQQVIVRTKNGQTYAGPVKAETRGGIDAARGRRDAAARSARQTSAARTAACRRCPKTCTRD